MIYNKDIWVNFDTSTSCKQVSFEIHMDEKNLINPVLIRNLCKLTLHNFAFIFILYQIVHCLSFDFLASLESSSVISNAYYAY
jgi:hypothetical protein